MKLSVGRRAWGGHELVITLVLVLTLGLTGVLAYQAQRATASHRETAAAALRDYAEFASWEFGRRLEEAVESSLGRAVIQARLAAESAGFPGSAGGSDPLERFRTTLHAAMGASSAAVHDVFLLDVPNATAMRTDAQLSEAFEQWLRTSLPREPRLAARGQGASGAPRGRWSIQTRAAPGAAEAPPGAGGLTVIQHPGTPHWDVFRVSLSDAAPGRVVIHTEGLASPDVVFGFALDVAAFMRQAAGGIMATAELLPPSLTQGRSNAEMLAVSVRTDAGLELYDSGDAVGATAPAVDTVVTRVASLVTEVAVRPQLAGVLIIGGLPGSRLPVTLLLFTSALALVTIAGVLLRRQHALARLRSDFVSSVSHELRTPLAQISMFAELLRSGRLDPEQSRRSVAIIHDEAQRLRYLVENVLRFSRVGRSDRTLQRAPTDISELVRAVAESFEPLVQAAGSRLELDVQPALTGNVDAHALRQVLLNLLDNAVKYGPRGQHIVLTARSEQGSLVVEVSDEGPGIPDSAKGDVWKPYHRLARAIEARTPGSGIGLAVVHELVQLHGGTVSVENVTPNGSRFAVRLPADPDAPVLSRRRTVAAPEPTLT